MFFKVAPNAEESLSAKRVIKFVINAMHAAGVEQKFVDEMIEQGKTTHSVFEDFLDDFDV